MVKPVFLSNLSHAFAGAIAKSIGAKAASSYPIILASGLRPLSFAASSLIKTNAAAPSFNFDEFAAVIVPDLANAGFNPANLSGRNFLHSSSSKYYFSFPFESTSEIN